ncbi:FecR family protein [Dyadobacter sp. CY312]|uniref:FecR family protein n=1 Tax=Dyadobacter sp. CY312 TaxID=2907303 RepID=UPI001F20D458|nr:FecR family protein [Dyadobacter sp. CY312]MCE7040092.1 FecR domain-containing protein [Dyadobacter sp. CY312]
MIKNLKAFLRLLDRYQKRRLNQEETKVLDIWYDSIDHTETKKDHLDDEQAGKLMWTAINKGMEPDAADGITLPLPFWKRNFYLRLAAACVLFLGVFIGYQYTLNNTSIIAGVKNEVVENMNQITNETSEQKIFDLPDGSKVTLEPGAKLFYPEVFADRERRVYLSGDVFFEIAHDTSRPFYVHANNIVTKVLGTSFTIRENKQKNSIEVAVLTGVVEVQQSDEDDKPEPADKKVVLTQNKKVTFYPQDEKLVTGIVEQPKIITTQISGVAKLNFNYLEKPLADIVPILEEAYGVKINLSNDRLRNCIITADLSQENTLFTQLEILCESIDAKYLLINDSVMLSGKGCDISK